MNKIPETRTSVEYQFTPVPSEVLERLAAAGLSGREFRIILVVMRKTWGWSKEKDKIPLSQFSRFTGIERRNCHVILTSLVKQKIIKKTVVTYGDRKIINYSFNDVYAEWKLSPPTATMAKKKTVATHSDTLSPSITTFLSPSITHSIDKDRNLSTESGEEPLGPPERVQELSLPTDKHGIPTWLQDKKIHTTLTQKEEQSRRMELQRQAALLREGAAIETGGCFNV